MKHLKLIIATLAVLAFATAAQAQLGGTSKMIDSALNATAAGTWTNRIVGGTSQTNGVLIDMRGKQFLAVQLKGELTGAGTTVWSLNLSKNVDGGTAREVFATISQTANGATATSTNSVYDVGGIPFVWLNTITNAGTVTLTNYSVWVHTK